MPHRPRPSKSPFYDKDFAEHKIDRRGNIIDKKTRQEPPMRNLQQVHEPLDKANTARLQQIHVLLDKANTARRDIAMGHIILAVQTLCDILEHQ